MTKRKLKLHPRHIFDRHLSNSEMKYSDAVALKEFLENKFDKKSLSDLKNLISNFHDEIFPAVKKKSAKKGKNSLFKLMTPSKDLAEIVGSKAMPRTEVVSKIWDYIRKHNLQNPKNKRNIIADEKLLVVFKKKEVTMFELAALIGQHLS